MTELRMHRWGLAIPLALMSLLFVGATAIGIWAYWAVDTTALSG
ncbi:hypothetical protein GCM10010435_08290 [Winogradskya consettensis]|uniref:Uncharacterized protein n=1 Tax=Winogradskya consettensis TaxID=113560 RepID=A0A919T0M4_9ACTN|nr:hypothetical protein [Actinoplanes consettensis]GIM80493.1 hypothetical protein Aco04nite_71010 [Actinoplanes consettensis]